MIEHWKSQVTQVLSEFILLLLFITFPLYSVDFYVANSGSDSGGGTQGDPFETLSHAASVAGSSDRIYLKRGDTFYASGVSINGEELNAYDIGPEPIITKSIEVTMTGTWASNGNVLTASVVDRVAACFVNGKFVRLARYPNIGDGFLRNNEGNTNADNIIDDDLSSRPGVAAGRWTGAQVRWRRWSWIWETRPISNHNSITSLVLSTDGKSSISNTGEESGYFIDNDLDELDDPGEWFWGGGTLYLYPPSWADPATMKVQVVTTTSTKTLLEHGDETVALSAGNNSIIRNIHFTRFFGNAFSIGSPAVVEDCIFSEIGDTGLSCSWNAQPYEIRRCVFRDIRNKAVNVNGNPGGSTGSLLERNLFLRIGVDPGFGGNGPWHAAGVIISNGNANTITLNRFVDTGYAGIILGSDGQTVQKNVFVRCMSTLNDGAAIYTNCSYSYIHENIILDTVGDLEYSQPWYPLGHGIWLEFLNAFHDSELTYNTMYGSNGHGIFLPFNFDCTLTGNVCVDNRRGGLGLFTKQSILTAQNHTISGNTLVTLNPSKRVTQADENLSMWWLPPYYPNEAVQACLEWDSGIDFGTMTDTDFIASASGVAVFREDSTHMSTLSEWTTAASSWADDTDSRVVRKDSILLFNDTESTENVTVPSGTWTYPDGSAVGATVSIAPFRSVVLVTDGDVSSLDPYYCYSDIDWRAYEPVNFYLWPDADINVTGNGIKIMTGDTTPTTDDGTDFGPVATSGGTADRTFIIESRGIPDLVLSGSPRVDITGAHASDFTVTADATTPVPGSGNTSFTIQFDSSGDGLRTATVTIESNDPEIANYTFDIQGTGDSSGDTDGDGMPDAWEDAHGLNKNVDDADLDKDGDGLTNLEEYTEGTDPEVADSDGDNLPDGWEYDNGFDPNTSGDDTGDPDGDTLTNLDEYNNDTNPNSDDTDGDTYTDDWELDNGYDPTDPDSNPDADKKDKGGCSYSSSGSPGSLCMLLFLLFTVMGIAGRKKRNA